MTSDRPTNLLHWPCRGPALHVNHFIHSSRDVVNETGQALIRIPSNMSSRQARRRGPFASFTSPFEGLSWHPHWAAGGVNQSWQQHLCRLSNKISRQTSAVWRELNFPCGDRKQSTISKLHTLLCKINSLSLLHLSLLLSFLPLQFRLFHILFMCFSEQPHKI